ncbi:MAG: ABC transporter substrate-binding protein [Anaerolineae bacterium]|nr:ABC transporter substrate-binding protein [Anaerolineae bacterium]
MTTSSTSCRPPTTGGPSHYRPSLFEQAGITEEPETWDEFLAACDTLNAAGIRPITIGTRYPWTTAGWFDYLNMRVNGPEFHVDLMLLGESYTDDRVAEVFTYWNQLLEHNCFIDDPAAYTWQEGLGFMARNEAAMYLIGQFIVDEITANYADQFATEDGGMDLDFFRFPIINPDVPIGEDAPTDGFFIAANARNLKAARISWPSSARRKSSRCPSKKWAACPPALTWISLAPTPQPRRASR